MLSCRICCLQKNCCVCGNKVPKTAEETKQEQFEREHYEYLMHVHAKLRKAQAKTTGNAALDLEIMQNVGTWYDPPRPLYVCKVKEMYDEAFMFEKAGNKNMARSSYKKLLLIMKDTDRIHYRITKADIEARVKELSR